MAIASADLTELWAATTTVELREDTSLMLRLLSQEHTAGWVNGAKTVNIPKPNYAQNDTPNPDEGVVASSRDRGGDWATARRLDQDLVELTRSGGFSTSNEVPMEDQIETNWNPVEKARSRQGYELARQINRGIYSGLRGGISSSNQESYGTAGTEFISRTAPYRGTAPTGTDPNEVVFNMLEDFALKAERANANVAESESVGMAWSIMPPEIFQALSRYMKDSGLSWDELTRQLLVDNSVLVNGIGFRAASRASTSSVGTGSPCPRAPATGRG